MQRQLDGSVKACFELSQAVLPLMQGRQGANMVIVATDLVTRPTIAYADYATAKSALVGMARQMAADLRPMGTVAHNMIAVKGMQRTFIVYTPKSLKANAPLLFVFHGSGGDGESMRDATGFEFDLLADRDGFVVVYPDGYQNTWNDCRKASPQPARRMNIDDESFVEAMIAKEAADHNVDRKRVFSAGWSNGGQLGYRFAMERPNQLAAVAAVVGVTTAAPLGEATFTVAAGGDDVDAVIFGYSLGGPGEPTTLVEGRLPTGPGEAVASEKDRADGFGIGDVVTVQPDGVAITVVGLARDLNYSVAPVLFVDPPTFESAKRTRTLPGPAVSRPISRVFVTARSRSSTTSETAHTAFISGSSQQGNARRASVASNCVAA